MTREEIVTALRCCDGGEYDECNKCPLRDGINCRNLLALAAADLIENQQREIEALRQANEGLRFNLAEAQRRGEGTPPYEADTDGPDGNEICRAALEAFGAEAQMVMAIEEMSELTKELCKRRRGRDNVEAIAEEVADVEIMFQQMVILFDCAGQVETFRRYKALQDALTIDAVPVVHAMWIPSESDFDDDDTLFDVEEWCDWQCCACREDICYDDPMPIRLLPKYCPNCGARMDGGDDHAAD